MKFGMFQTPFLSPGIAAKESFKWTVEQAVAADQAGFSEYWVGEHATLDWENVPNPELVIAAAALQTKNIKLGPLAHLLPYHHPATLAIQSAWLSQILEGRYQMGVAMGAYPSDAALRGMTDLSQNFAMMLEAIDIMEKVWKCEPFHFEGKYWKAGFPEQDATHHYRDMRPWGGTMPMAMTGLSSPSSSIKFAAERGFIPASVYAGNAFLKSHFDLYANVSRQQGRITDRSTHRVVRDVIVADTDAEAKRIATTGGMARAWMEYLKPTLHRFGVLAGLFHDEKVNADDVDPNYLADHVWICGSPETVVEKLEKWFDDLGGPFGTILLYDYDFISNPKPWRESMSRLVSEVAPKLSKVRLAAE